MMHAEARSMCDTKVRLRNMVTHVPLAPLARCDRSQLPGLHQKDAIARVNTAEPQVDLKIAKWFGACGDIDVKGWKAC